MVLLRVPIPNICHSFQIWNRHFFVLFKNRLFWTGETNGDEDEEQEQEQNWDGPLSSEVVISIQMYGNIVYLYRIDTPAVRTAVINVCCYEGLRLNVVIREDAKVSPFYRYYCKGSTFYSFIVRP